ncbi:MAG: MoxR family ATPase [Phycisphaeraceae bacterium]
MNPPPDTSSVADAQRADQSPDVTELAGQMEQFRDCFARVREEVGRSIVGHRPLITDTLVAIFSQGHVLFESVPGLGKTYLVRVLSRVLGLSGGRIQCTPDLMPADILGTHILGEDDAGHRSFRFEQGPVFHNVVLVDEVNRATPKTQAALLEAMQERAVTAGGRRFALPEPFFVLATQNPLEMEGTYPLPEAQLDRFFFKLKVPFPSADELVEISRQTTTFTQREPEAVLDGPELIAMQRMLTHVPLADPLAHYAAAVILATHPGNRLGPDPVNRYVLYGASPRGLQAMIRAARVHCVLDGRTTVSLDDLKAAARPALRHRLVLNFEGQAERIDVDDVVGRVLDHVPAPAGEA